MSAPAAPPAGSLVVDVDGDVWRESDGAWSCLTDATARPLVWASLLHMHGPLDVFTWRCARHPR